MGIPTESTTKEGVILSGAKNLTLQSYFTLFLILTVAIPALGNTNSTEDSPWFIALFLLIYCGIFLVMGLYYVLLIFALVDIARAQNEGNWKLMWALISIFAGLIGMAVYWFVGRHDRIPPKPKPTS